MALHHNNFCLVKPRERALRDKITRILQGLIPYALEPIVESSQKVPPHKEAKKALCYKTKSCSIQMHEYETNMLAQLYSILILL